MTRPRLASLACTIILLTAGYASADSICKAKNGAITARPKCKRGEATLAPEVLGALGLRGPAGEKGERGNQGVPGQAGSTGAQGTQGVQGVPGLRGEPGRQGSGGGGLEVVDSDGDLVGVVGDASHFGADAFRKVGNDLLAFGVNAAGFQTQPVDVTFFNYTTSNCAGARYLGDFGYYYGGGIAPRPTDLAVDVTTDPGLIGHFGRASELQTQQYYFVAQIYGSAAGALLDCTQGKATYENRGPGVSLGSVPCPYDPESSCLRCCVPHGDWTLQLPNRIRVPPFVLKQTAAAPERTLDLGALGLSPPFRLEP